MDEQLKPAVNGESIAQQDHSDPPPTAPSEVPEPKSSAPEQAATAQQLNAVEQQMSAFERSTLKWARAAVIVSGLAFAVVCAQWWEMHTGSTDTHNLAVAARNQATWTQRLAANTDTESGHIKDLADQMKAQADRTKDLADRMKDQAVQTKTIADQAIIQAKAAKSAAETAKEALHVSQRAYITIEGPTLDEATGVITIPLNNTGRIPAGKTVITVHEATMRTASGVNAMADIPSAIERHWNHMTYEYLPVGIDRQLILPIPAFDKSAFDGGNEVIMIAGEIHFNDGFSDTPDQIMRFCVNNMYHTVYKKQLWVPCDASVELPILIANDGYPNNEQK